MEGGEHSYAGWKDVPLWFLTATEDNTLHVEVQRMSVRMAKDDGTDVTSREVPSRHSSM